MKHYWSCWITEDELKQYGASNLYPAMHLLNGTLIPYGKNTENYWCFTAEDNFDSFLKLAIDRSIAEISAYQFDSIVRGVPILIDPNSLIGKCLMECSLDF